MSSWFNISSFDDLKNKVSETLPVDREMLDKLTLTTPEMTAERQRIYEEEIHKDTVKDMLTAKLPWETTDEGREILVEDCKEAIMALSSQEETFYGPYKLPPKAIKEDEEETDEDGEEGGNYEIKQEGPSPESLAKLAKLEPLPPLLGDFDLDAHVGLIQRLLEVDTKLVDMQSNLSGGGERERTFWRNYFFHCAFTRYEAGLSVDEIWSEEPRQKGDLEKASSDHGGAEEVDVSCDTITFEETTTEQNTGGNLFDAMPAASSSAVAVETEKVLSSDSLNASESADYEFVADSDDGANSEMDELEAEIARELED